MMWKESYRIGIEEIDAQHRKLFEMTEGLLKAIEEKQGPEAFESAIHFLKEYVVVHFRDEEAYQASIQYAGMEEHVEQHRAFTDTVLSFEKRLQQSSYALPVVKELAGTLTAWLIYHVADADQKLAGKSASGQETASGSYIDIFGDSVHEVLGKMAGLESMDIKVEKEVFAQVEDDVVVTVGLTGDYRDSVVFGFSREFAVKLFEAMTFMSAEEVDELVCSALSEMSNIICGNMSILLAKKGVEIDIKPPVFAPGAYMGDKGLQGMRVLTKLGGIKIAIAPGEAAAS